MTMTSAFQAGDLSGGIANGVLALAEHAQPPKSLHTDPRSRFGQAGGPWVPRSARRVGSASARLGAQRAGRRRRGPRRPAGAAPAPRPRCACSHASAASDRRLLGQQGREQADHDVLRRLVGPLRPDVVSAGEVAARRTAAAGPAGRRGRSRRSSRSGWRWAARRRPRPTTRPPPSPRRAVGPRGRRRPAGARWPCRRASSSRSISASSALPAATSWCSRCQRRSVSIVRPVERLRCRRAGPDDVELLVGAARARRTPGRAGAAGRCRLPRRRSSARRPSASRRRAASRLLGRA